MMGTKERTFAPLVAVSLEALVPPDHFYRHLDRTLELSLGDVKRQSEGHLIAACFHSSGLRSSV